MAHLSTGEESHSISTNSTITPIDIILSHLHQLNSKSKPKLSISLITSINHYLHDPTLPAPSLSALLTALSHLPPFLLTPYAVQLSISISKSVHLAAPVLTTSDFTHAARLITLLAASSHLSAFSIRNTGAPLKLLHDATNVISKDFQLIEALRRMAIIVGLSASQYKPLLRINHSLRSRAELFVAAATPISYKRPLRILSLDGGGTRAILSIQILKQIEYLTGHSISSSFDLICGTSSGGILATAIGLLNMSLKQCEDLYLNVGKEIFNPKSQNLVTISPNGIYQAGRLLLLNRGLYNSKSLSNIFDKYCGDRRFCDVVAGNGIPRVFVLSTQISSIMENIKTPQPYLHCNYGLNDEKNNLPRYSHGSLHKLSDGLRATTAAPIYFDVFQDELGQTFCDGGVLVNNPTAVAIHEARQLWPGREIGIVVSIGTGLFVENELKDIEKKGIKEEERLSLSLSSSIKDKANIGNRRNMVRIARAVLNSATDTESVHHAIEDLNENEDLYYRLNPKLQGEDILLDEFRPKVLERLKSIGQQYCIQGGEGEKMIRKLCTRLSHSKYGIWRNTKNGFHSKL